MNLSTLKTELNKILTTDNVSITEYQDKYYFVKSLREVFPEMPEKYFYNALDSTNNRLKAPRVKSNFVRVFATELIEQFTNIKK